MPDKRCRSTPLEALRDAVEAATGESVTISKDAAEEALRWLERAVQISEQRDRWGEELDHTHRVLRRVWDQVQESQLEAKRDAIVEELAAIATAELEKEMQALRKERRERTDQQLRQFDDAIESVDFREREQEIVAEVGRRLQAEGLEPLAEGAAR